MLGKRRGRMLVAGASLLSVSVSLVSCGNSGGGDAPSSGPVYFGVSAPLSGDKAEYGTYWKQGFQLALDEINGKGGIGGRPVKLRWEDSQSDPKQSGPIATKFVDDSKIVAELGDFSSSASMAASPIYQRGGMVQYGFTNSNPDFTKGGDLMWSPCETQDFLQEKNVEIIKKYVKKVAVVYQDTDWGKSAYDAFTKWAGQAGIQVTYKSSFLPTSTDFRPVLLKARDSEPEALVHLGYAPDGALIAKQIRAVGFKGRFFGGQNTQQFLDLAGPDAEGDILPGDFLPGDPDPLVQAFVTKFHSKYHALPNAFNVMAYDALTDLAFVAEKGGATRAGIKKGLEMGLKLPSVYFKGSFSFDDQRRPSGITTTEIIVKSGKFVPNTGS
ncbi:ABC transporter substrate-binding protein [Streptomyces sp.]|uniref:ABC transporter substrate-binding protein n=1 Tax=Streptomyces sp. TaxID=1931 RepID=UPI002F3F0506